MIGYEWIVETVDEHGDVLDTCGWNTYAEAQKHASALKAEIGSTSYADSIITRIDIGLVRDRWSESEGVEDRQWAYLDWNEDGKLPANFDGGAKVPQRFHREISQLKG